MDADSLKLDGNAAAGILQQIFAVEVTTVLGTCDHCGQVEAVGAVMAYMAAGTVLRCPHCESLLAKVVTDGERIWADFRGVRSFELRV